jgi:hypothetical protein
MIDVLTIKKFYRVSVNKQSGNLLRKIVFCAKDLVKEITTN